MYNGGGGQVNDDLARLQRLQAVTALMIGAFTFGTGVSGVVVYIDGFYDALQSSIVHAHTVEDITERNTKRVERLESLHFNGSYHTRTRDLAKNE